MLFKQTKTDQTAYTKYRKNLPRPAGKIKLTFLPPMVKAFAPVSCNKNIFKTQFFHLQIVFHKLLIAKCGFPGTYMKETIAEENDLHSI